MTFDLYAWERLFADRPTGPVEARPIMGLRLCRIGEFDDDLCLTGLGVGANYRWKPGLNVASCSVARTKAGHQPPGRRCGCGLYACTDVAALLRILGPIQDQVVLCAVAGSGRVQVHERGWRAQYAEVVAVSAELPGRVVRAMDGRVLRITRRCLVDHEVLVAVAKTFRVPLVSLTGLEDIVKKGGT